MSLCEQLDAMLLGWLERRAGRHQIEAGATAVAVLTVGTRHVPEVEAFCATWGLRVERIGGSSALAAMRVSGPALPVIGFSEITTMYRS